MTSHLLLPGFAFSVAGLTPVAIVQVTVAISILLASSKVIYNLYFHPLHEYPGPVLARATAWYISLLELNGNLHLKTKEWHDKYGDVVRTSPNSLSYISSQAWEEICGHRSSSHTQLFEKDRDFFIPPPNGKANIVAANGEEHRRLRRLLAHAFSDRALRAQESCIQGYVDLFISQLRTRAAEGQKVNMVHWFNFTTFDVIGDLAFGENFALLKNGVWSRYLSSIFGFLKFASFMRMARRVLPASWHGFFEKMTPQKHKDDRMYQYHLAKDKLARRVALDTDKHDFVYYMLKGSQEAVGPDGLSFEEMVSQGSLLMLAGSETTATLLSGLLYYVLINPPVLARLKAEINSSFTGEKDINIQHVAELRYLHAVIEESLRMYPPVPNVLPRAAPETGAFVCGRFVPPGTSIGMHHYSCYRSPKNFIDPDAFHPERWIEGENEPFSKDDKSAFHPFSHGPRNCLGKNLAYAELRLIVSKFFWNFDVELQPESKDWAKQKSNILWVKNPLFVKLIPRERL